MQRLEASMHGIVKALPGAPKGMMCKCALQVKRAAAIVRRSRRQKETRVSEADFAVVRQVLGGMLVDTEATRARWER